VFPNLDRHIAEAEGRVIITTFASSIHRVSMILELALKNGRKVGLLGRSMLNVIAKARELGYMRAPDELFVPIKQINDVPDRETLLLMTGSQGEPLAALSRISRGDHPQVKVKTSDTIIFSASPIPGNTISVVNTIDKLMILGAKVVYGKGEGIHVSGHGFQEDQKLMLALTRPKYFVPVHGEHRMLVKHARTGHSMGVPEDNTLIINNGDVVELTPDSMRKGDPVKAGIELLDQSRNGIVDARVLKERQQLAVDGIVTILAAISTDGAMVAPPRVNLRGVVTTADARKMSLWTEREIKWVLENRWKQLCRQVDGGSPEVDWMGVQREVEVGLGRRMRREMQVEPLILCLVQPAPGGTPVYKGRADAEPDTRPASRGRGGRHGGPGRDSGNGHVRRDRNAAPARVVPSRVIGTPAPAAGSAPAEATPAPVSAPVKEPVAATVVVTSAPEPEMPAGRTRRRRSAAA
jgi:ribonuclease J